MQDITGISSRGNTCYKNFTSIQYLLRADSLAIMLRTSLILLVVVVGMAFAWPPDRNSDGSRPEGRPPHHRHPDSPTVRIFLKLPIGFFIFPVESLSMVANSATQKLCLINGMYLISKFTTNFICYLVYHTVKNIL